MDLDLNRQLAELLGWSNIVTVGGALLGRPPEGQPECRGQAQVPDWTGDWRACGALMASRIDISCEKFRIQVVTAAIQQLSK